MDREALRRWGMRCYLAVGLACLFVSWELLRSPQGTCVSYCTPAFRAGVLVVVGGGCGVLSMTVGARRSAAALCLAALATIPVVLLRLH